LRTAVNISRETVPLNGVSGAYITHSEVEPFDIGLELIEKAKQTKGLSG
jgi:hypothetical protein